MITLANRGDPHFITVYTACLDENRKGIAFANVSAVDDNKSISYRQVHRERFMRIIILFSY